MKLKGRSAIISGASQGFGFEIAKQFIAEGANVMLCARDKDMLNQVQKTLQHLAGPSIQVLSKPTDVSKPDDVEALVATTVAQFGKIDILVANAGIYGTKGPIEEVDWEEWSHAIDINLKGTVLQCRSVLPYFKKQLSGKIIVISGGGATKPMPNLSAYAASKAGVVRFAETLSEEVKAFHIDVNTVAPGALNTRLLDEIIEAGPEKVGQSFYNQSLLQKQTGGTSLSTGAALCAFLASDKSNGITGRLLSAIWDPWENLPNLVSQIEGTDIYTLRRIVPKDRGHDWDIPS